MSADDELVDRLAAALDEDVPREPPADRVALLRARAATGPPTAAAAPLTTVTTTATPTARAPVQVSTTPTRAVPTVVPRPRARWWALGAIAAAVVALLVGFAVARVITDDGNEEIAGDVEFDGSMTGPDGGAFEAELTVVATGTGRVLELRTSELPVLPLGEHYQVWFVGPGDAPGTPNRISAGTFHPDRQGRSDVRFSAAVDPRLFPLVEITAEPPGGDPAPTSAVVLRAQLGT